MDLLIGLDVGTTSVKAGLFDPGGARPAVAGEEYQLDHPGPDRVELDPDRYWSAAQAAIRRVVADGGVDRHAIAAIAVSSQGETILPVDSTGRALAPALVWLDNRAVAEANELARQVADGEAYDVTGIPTIVPTWPACKILWWRRHAPDVFAAAYGFLLVEDLLLHRLTGRFRVRGWRPVHLALVRHPDRRLVAADARPGRDQRLAAAGARDTRRTGRHVAAIGGRRARPGPARSRGGRGEDQGAGAVGVGNVRAGMVSKSTGGALTVQASVAGHGHDTSRQTPVYVHSAPGAYLYCPVCPTGGMAFDPVPGHFWDGGDRPRRSGRAQAPTISSPRSRRPCRRARMGC